MKKGKYYLVTTYDWFYGPDGETYKAAWGKFEDIIKFEDVLGFAPVRPSTNWMAVVGANEPTQITIAGCQIQYAVRCDDRPRLKEGFIRDSGGNDQAANKIYFTE